MTKLRKDNYAVATTDNGPVYGKVSKVDGDNVVLATPAGSAARVLRANTTKISAKEYVERGVVTASTFDAVDAEVGVVAEEKNSISRPGGDRKPGRKGTGKKEAARAVYARLSANGPPARKDVMVAFMNEVGLTKAGSNTYFQSFKSGKWSI